MTAVTEDEIGLLNGIQADPGNDLPRLVYADYLEDRGFNGRADYIRLACRAASFAWAMLHDRKSCGVIGCGDCQAHAEYDDLSGRVYVIQARTNDWWHPYGNGRLVFNHRWHRGFVADSSVRLYALYNHPEQVADLFRFHPLERLRLNDRTPLCTRTIPAAWEWHRSHNWDNNTACIPRQVFGRIEDSGGYGTKMVWRHASAVAAETAISNAAIAFGREFVQRKRI